MKTMTGRFSNKVSKSPNEITERQSFIIDKSKSKSIDSNNIMEQKHYSSSHHQLDASIDITQRKEENRRYR